MISDLVPFYEDYNPVTAMAGEATSTTCKTIIMTVDSPTTNTVTFVCNGITYTGVTGTPTGNQFQLVPVGEDRGSLFTEAGWIGALLVENLASTYQRFTWSVNQGVNTDNGSFTNNPAPRDDYWLATGTCDNNTNFSNLSNVRPYTVVGYWKRLKALMQDTSRNECAGMLFIDDILGYVDSKNIDDSDSSGQYATDSGQNSLLAYDYFLAWFAMFGMLGANVDKTSTLNTDLNRLWGREVNRSWCRKNMNWRVGFGDHEFTNDIGWSTNLATVPNPIHATAGLFDGVGLLAYNTIWGALNPDAISGATDSNAQHRVNDIGCVSVAHLDWISNSSSTGNIFGAAIPPTPITTLAGAPQIEDVLNKLNVPDTKFKIIMMANGMRYVAPSLPYDGTSGSVRFSAHPIYDHTKTEFQQLFTASDNALSPSIMDGKYTNGLAGTTIVLFGDQHIGGVARHHSDAYTNNHAEEIYEFHLGTMNGSLNHTLDADIVTGYKFVHGGVKVDLEHVMDKKDTTEYGNNNFYGTRLEITGSKPIVEMRVICENSDSEVVWDKKFIHRNGNTSHELSAEPFKAMSSNFEL